MVPVRRKQHALPGDSTRPVRVARTRVSARHSDWTRYALRNWTELYAGTLVRPQPAGLASCWAGYEPAWIFACPQLTSWRSAARLDTRYEL